MNHTEKIKIHLKDYQHRNAFVHFIGCGGAGTMPLLKIFSELGFSVSGSDMAESPAMTLLAESGFTVHCGHKKENLPPAEGKDLLVVYSSAIKKDNPELLEAQKRSAKCILRGEALGLVAELFPTVIAVSGTHGKTSISSMIVHILEKASFTPGYLIGGNLPGKTWNGSAGNKEIFVCEADESDGTHTAIHASCAVVSNIEDDHVWNFASEGVLLDNFRSFAFSAPHLVYNAGEKTDLLYKGKHPDHYRITEVERNDLSVRKRLRNFPLYQKENAFLAAKCVEKLFQIPCLKALEFLADFAGVGRRLTVHYEGLEYTLIEDYAHHPTEVEASLRSLREMYPESILYLVFQPHRYARLERYFEEFAGELGRKEYSPDKVYVAPVFAAWSETGKVGAEDLVASLGKNAQLLAGSWENMAEKVLCSVKEKDGAGEKKKRKVIAVLGAGDVVKILPFLKEPLKEKDMGEKTGVVIAAGGSSSRYGAKNKLFEELDSLPVFLHCLKNFVPYLPDEHVVLTVPQALKEDFARLLEKYQYLFKGKNVVLVNGGSCREESVYNGVKALPEECGYIAVHDAARPFADHFLLLETLYGAEISGGSIAAKKVTDTIKETDEKGLVARTVPRENLWAVQTPQTFRRDILLEAFCKGKEELKKFTDDSSLVERFTSCKVGITETVKPNIKVTFPEDLLFAQMLLQKN